MFARDFLLRLGLGLYGLAADVFVHESEARDGPVGLDAGSATTAVAFVLIEVLAAERLNVCTLPPART